MGLKDGIFKVTLVALAVTAGCNSPAADSGQTAANPSSTATAAAAAPPSATASATSAQAPYDLRFIDTMAAHHDEAIEMAQMAVDKASDPKVKAMAQKTVDDQQKEKQQIQSWRQQWYGTPANAHDMTLPGAAVMNEMDMSKMQAATGREFDRQFVEMMIRHHEGAVEMGRDAAARAEHSEVRQKGQEIADKQQAEIEQMRGMLKRMGG